MPYALASVHYTAIATVIGVGLGGIAGTLWRLGSTVQRWRDESAGAVGQLAGLVADWCDEVDDHLERQDAALTRASVRLGGLEGAAGLPREAPYVPVRPRRRPRRLDAESRGLQPHPRAPGGLD